MPTNFPAVWIVITLIVCVMVAALAWLWLTPARRHDWALRKTIRQIGAETLTDIVIADGVDGEIQIDLVLLTASGLLVLEVKRVEGTVFGGTNVDSWTALTPRSRVAFSNPLDLLNRRIVALRTFFGDDVPVDGRVVLVGNVTLGADLPASVTTAATLAEQFAHASAHKSAAAVKAFYPHWDRLCLSDRLTRAG